MRDVNWRALIPELNDGEDDPDEWLCDVGTPSLAVAFTRMFWPRFVEVEGLIFRDEMDKETVATWMASCAGDRAKVEGTLNHVHIASLFDSRKATAEQVAHIGKILREMYQAKLSADFPDRQIEVIFYEPPNKALDDYQITFYQKHAS